ncbi:hypothetical protein VNO77_26775 [Canavalia gladiata]|uniref:Uncharacterized protein n=1 Tax=Canavalia gladiata TaxID=3824 RepID=A0AAN9KVZ8_CANGL
MAIKECMWSIIIGAHFLSFWEFAQDGRLFPQVLLLSSCYNPGFCYTPSITLPIVALTPSNRPMDQECKETITYILFFGNSELVAQGRWKYGGLSKTFLSPDSQVMELPEGIACEVRMLNPNEAPYNQAPGKRKISLFSWVVMQAIGPSHGKLDFG